MNTPARMAVFLLVAVLAGVSVFVHCSAYVEASRECEGRGVVVKDYSGLPRCVPIGAQP